MRGDVITFIIILPAETVLNYIQKTGLGLLII